MAAWIAGPIAERLADAARCADALAAAVAVLLGIDGVGSYRLRLLYLLVAPLMVLAAKLGGLYDRDELVIEHSTLNELPRLLNLVAIFALLVWLARHYVIVGNPRTLNLLLLWLVLAAGLVVGRLIAREVARRVAPVERCLLVGRRNVFERLERKFRAYPRVRLVGLVKTAEIRATTSSCVRSPSATTSTASSSTPMRPTRRRRSRSCVRRTRPGCRSACCRACSARSVARSCSTTSAA
jgi:FlaA1/EpsC-like NDP-sugar epimerase